MVSAREVGDYLGITKSGPGATPRSLLLVLLVVMILAAGVDAVLNDSGPRWLSLTGVVVGAVALIMLVVLRRRR